MKSKSILFVIFVILLFMFTSCRLPEEEQTPGFIGSPGKEEKPVIYLYPDEETEIEVKLEYHGKLICTYPKYEDGWNVIAQPDGILRDIKTGKQYSYLFWEGRTSNEWNITEGFIVKGENTMEFLQEKLAFMGLYPNEYNEFIVYWLPRMLENKYNLIYFAKDEYEKMAKLSINPQPDSILRVFMVFKALDKPIDILEQELETFDRKGFTVIEWGGTEIN